MALVRLDDVVAQRAGISRSQARSLILEGRVQVDGVRALKAGQNVRAEAIVAIDEPRRFVSRGGEKLDAALDAFGLDVTGLRVLDVGASTGGFTDCVLQRGAREVTAVDVGYGQLDWRLRNDARVHVMERTNFRHLPDDAFAQPFDAIVVDASFISLRTILRRAAGFLAPPGWIVALVKPQFEAGRTRLGKGGVVRDPGVHRAVLREIRDDAASIGVTMTNLIVSPLLGPAGNREFLAELRTESVRRLADARIDEVVGEALSS
jgi:23S rRNA (cytidine1920-2'-O)/16S rRNA (cytidine1409-2'-O)-methyltransferase